MIKVFLYERHGRVYLEPVNSTGQPASSLPREDIQDFHYIAGSAKNAVYDSG